MFDMRHGLVGCLAVVSFVCLGAPTDKDLGLHSDGGAWRFYPNKEDRGDLPRVLLIGDSILNGHRGRVIAGLKDKASVDCWLTPLHLASGDLHHDLQKVLEQGPYDVVHFNIGLHGWTPGRIPESQYEPLLKAYVDILRGHSPTVKPIWASTTPMTVKGKPTELDPIHNQTIIDRNAVAARVMQNYGIPVNDLYGLVRDKLRLARGDRFHWHGEAYGLMANQVTRYIEEALGEGPGGRRQGDMHTVRNDPYRLRWVSPGKNAHDSMPIGNGDIGANVWVEQDGDLVFFVSKTDAWSENGRLLKLGRVRVELDPPLAVAGPGTSFSQDLILRDGVIEVKSARGARQSAIRFWIDANAPVIHLDAESNADFSLTASLEVWRKERRQLHGQEAHSAYGLHGEGAPEVFVEPDTVVSDRDDRVVWYHRNERSLWADNLKLQALGDLAGTMQDPLLHRTSGACMTGEGLKRASSTTLIAAKPGKQFSLQIHPLTKHTGTAAEWVRAVEGMAQGGASRRFDSHVRWWREFWDRSFIHIAGDADAELVTRAYALQRWVNACSGRGTSPIKFNGSIFNVDDRDKGGPYDADYRRWGGPYWWQNTRLPYWTMLSAGDYDLMQPLFLMFLESLPLRKAATRKYYGHGGAFYPETQYFWGTYCDANYGRDRSNLPDGMTENRYIRYYWQGGLELSLMMLDTFAHTGDEAFTRDTLLPLATEIVTFFDQHWKRDPNGKIRFDPAMALETYRVAVNPLVEIVGIRKVCEELLALPESLTTTAHRQQWKRLMDELPPVPTREVDEQTVLACAASYSGRQNTENPELYAVFPYRRYGLGKPALDLARRTFACRAVKHTGGWSQDAIQAAHLGLPDEARGFVVQNAKSRAAGYRFPAMWGPNFDWIPDQDHGGVMMIALQRMLLQYEGREIRVLPAWPDGWDVVFKLHAPEKTTVEGAFRGGRLEDLVVTPAHRKKDVIPALRVRP